jgi:uroporphyrinogen-III decarboxylase
VSRAGNRQRLRAAYEGRFTGEVPFFESYVAEGIVDRVMGRPMGTHMLKLAPADYVDFLKRTGMDAAYVAEGWFLGRRNVTDENGHVHYVDGTIKSRDDFDQIVPPSLDRVRERIESVLEATHAANLGVAFGLDMSVSTVMTAIGPIDSLTALYDDPDFVNEFLDRAEEYTIPLAECVSQYPLDGIWLTGLTCANAGPVISPAMHEEFILPRVEKVMRIIRPSGIPAVLHSDGDNSVFMDWIVRTGFSALHPIEPGVGKFDIYTLKETYGSKICLCGNIDVGAVLARGTPEDVRVDTLEHIRRLAPGGGYVCGSSHDITENIPFENFAMLAKTVCSAVVRESGVTPEEAVAQTSSRPE